MARGASDILGWVHLDLVRLLLLGIPALVLNWFLLGNTPSAAGSSWQLAVVLVPLFAVCLVLWRVLRRDRAVTLGWGFLGFFFAYCLFFSIATGADLLSGKRTLLSGYEEEVPRSLLGFNRMGDWHYLVAGEAPPVDDLIIITLPSLEGRLRGEVRQQFAFLIRKAVEQGARGVAFDYFMEQTSPADGLLVRILDLAAGKGVPVLFGYRQKEEGGALVRQEIAESLAAAVPLNRQGHLAGYQEADGRVRMIPLELPGPERLPALSRQLAELMHGGPLELPENRLLQFVRPTSGVPVHEFAPDMDWGLLRNRFVLVGTASPSDQATTAYGELQGVVLHAFAANSLQSGEYVRRFDSRHSFPLVFSMCYVLTVLYAKGWEGGRLSLVTASLVGLTIVGAALAMNLNLVWIDVSYPIAALVLFVAMLQVQQRLRASRVGAADASPQMEPPAIPADPEGSSAAPAREFDVFLSHNSADKPVVEELAKKLQARGLNPWLDKWELVPGRPWQEGLEDIISNAHAAAVMVGGDGLGPWEIPEMRVCLSECVRRGLPVIPVLLPGAPKQPDLPLFLTQFTWVDLRGGLNIEGLDRLQWGITGEKPPRIRPQ